MGSPPSAFLLQAHLVAVRATPCFRRFQEPQPETRSLFFAFRALHRSQRCYSPRQPCPTIVQQPVRFRPLPLLWLQRRSLSIPRALSLLSDYPRFLSPRGCLTQGDLRTCLVFRFLLFCPQFPWLQVCARRSYEGAPVQTRIPVGKCTMVCEVSPSVLA